MRAVALVGVLMGLAGCDDLPAEGGNPGLFEPFMFNDLAYDVSFVGENPVVDAALLAQGFAARRDIRVTRVRSEPDPFGIGDEAEAKAVAAAFCFTPLTFLQSPDGGLDGSGGFVFSGNCLVPEG